MSRLVLIDGNAILHRAYHALPPLTNRNGQQVNAVYGFASIMLRIIDELKPEYLAVAFDRPEPTFRKQLYIGYQSKRKEMDTELAGQIDLVHELVEAFGVRIFEKAGYEADDILGTIAMRFSENQARNPNIPACSRLRRQPLAGREIRNKSRIKNSKKDGEIYIDSDFRRNDKEEVDEVVIVTGDRDLMQLVNDKVKLYMPTRGMSVGEMVDKGEVKRRLGVEPSQVVDYKALVGDSSDNYPGVKGIGPKGALGLIGEFGTVNSVSGIDGVKGFREIYRRINEITNDNLRQKLLEGKESGELSYKLATIKTDVEVKFDLEENKTPEYKNDKLGEFFRQMGFRSLEKRLTGDPPLPGNNWGSGEARKKKDAISENQQSLF